MNRSDPSWDAIVIGGGAAGFFGAITHAEHGGGRTLILEQARDVLGKVRVSGGGRCNVTHDERDPKAFAGHYPRGEKALIGPLHRWGAEDTIRWFEGRGVRLKTESDGRMFPTTDRSETIIDCLWRAAERVGVKVWTNSSVEAVEAMGSAEAGGGHEGARFLVKLRDGQNLSARSVLLATGGTRARQSGAMMEGLGHTLMPPVPSLFTFKIRDPRLRGLAGVSVPMARCAIERLRWRAEGPVLVTHWVLAVLASCGFRPGRRGSWPRAITASRSRSIGCPRSRWLPSWLGCGENGAHVSWVPACLLRGCPNGSGSASWPLLRLVVINCGLSCRARTLRD